MKSLALFLVIAVVGANAAAADVDATKENRLVTDAIISAIHDASQWMKDAGLDPLEVERYDIKEVYLPMLIEVDAFVENLVFTGASNIAINRMDFSVLTNRLRFDLSLPELYLSIGKAGGHAVVFNNEYEAEASGRLTIRQVRLAGEVQVNVGIISGISIRYLSLDFSVAIIFGQVSVTFQGIDISSIANEYINVIIPNFLYENRAAINLLLERLAWRIINEYL